jgi:hypothetical protein
MVFRLAHVLDRTILTSISLCSFQLSCYTPWERSFATHYTIMRRIPSPIYLIQRRKRLCEFTARQARTRGRIGKERSLKIWRYMDLVKFVRTRRCPPRMGRRRGDQPEAADRWAVCRLLLNMEGVPILIEVKSRTSALLRNLRSAGDLAAPGPPEPWARSRTQTPTVSGGDEVLGQRRRVLPSRANRLLILAMLSHQDRWRDD